MKTLKFIAYILFVFFLSQNVQNIFAQNIIQGKIFDKQTNEALFGATVVLSNNKKIGTVADANGNFALQTSEKADSITVSYVGYENMTFAISSQNLLIALPQSEANLQTVVVTASREAQLRTDAPVAISRLSPTIINDTKPTLVAELINKISGVVMLNYNNEQHGMSIRQPMGTSAYFLYMEDGIPVRPMGVFNHNALIEMNIFAISSVEVVKGPASSLYGPEAVGGAINFITQRPTAIPTAKIGIQADQWGYQRIQYGAGAMLTKKLGVYIGGFVAKQRDSWQTFSDYDKFSINARVDYNLTEKTKLIWTLSNNDYNSQTGGGVDSIAFYNRQYTSSTNFTYRKVHSLRTKLAIEHQWNKNNETTLSLFYRDNAIGQNPSYGIRWVSGASTATGEINENSFYSRGFVLQHSKKFEFLNAKLLAGASMDNSPTTYWAYQIDLAAQLRADKKSVETYTITKERPDIQLANYKADLVNTGIYTQFEINPLKALKMTFGLRYDRMALDYVNNLDKSSGKKVYEKFTPKIGATYDLGKGKGLYANYSQGFSPPSLTAIFRKRPNPDPNAPAEFYYNLEPAQFDNIEFGGWASFMNNKIYVDFAFYQMNGRKELLNIRQPDNSFDYQSAGKTLHQGIEYGITFKPNDEWFLRFGGTNAVHRFVEFTLSTKSTDQLKNVDGLDMPQSPKWIANSEITYKPKFLKGFRISAEWQRISAWFQNQTNTVSYNDKGFLGMEGISFVNLRTGYEWKGIEIFMNVMNLTNELYANAATRGNNATDRTTYTPAAPRTFVMGLQYSFSGKK
ncbi:MAG: TonB-dependent receptor [Bacteroidetes bacterium]|nr:MAG: TonB-dependent receptor [Bacteroidota bacterium]